MKRISLLAAMIMLSLSLTGCVRPYQKPIIETVETHESAVMIALVGDTENQEQAKSEEFYMENMVYAKEVEIPTRWIKTGRNFLGIFPQGEWRPSAMLIKVSRAPESREWVDGTGGTSSVNQGFDVESKDSIGFSFGVVATAQVEESNIAKFLYRYGGRQLASVMDEEIRNHVQSILSDVATKYTLENIDAMKLEAIAEVRKHVIPYFKERGIAVTNIGFKGGLAYEDKEIQKAFNSVIVAEKNRDAQVLENERLASKNVTENEIKIAKAKAEAEEAQIKARNWEVYSKIRNFDLREKQLDKWDGTYPTHLLTDNAGLIFDLTK
jgi:hypothetical protein